MLKLKRCLAVGALSIAVSVTSMVPAGAVTFPKVPVPKVSDVEQVQYGRRIIKERHHWRGHRGYRHHRPGYRRHSDGWWYPLAAFGIGTIVGGAIANQPAAGGNAHVNWCANRYRSYRAYDNTFQPYNGPRQQCISPYGR
ncbi:BA14K family protein [Shinella pollutisoli]|uniref:Lectin-like protein BA14k n=1 Tax=Shinella pollutisoli TaxID=2250594 RepID=A0ABV7DCP7_9HYPH|nr:BA14K family protein [Shinella pollutisoli]